MTMPPPSTPPGQGAKWHARRRVSKKATRNVGQARKIAARKAREAWKDQGLHKQGSKGARKLLQSARAALPVRVATVVSDRRKEENESELSDAFQKYLRKEAARKRALDRSKEAEAKKSSSSSKAPKIYGRRISNTLYKRKTDK